jgi:hypothetical protein
VDEEGPSLREIAGTLTTSARSGLVLTKDRIAAIAAKLSLPVGFTDRNQMLVNMFRAAAEYERIPALLDALNQEADRWESRYVAWTVEYPASGPIWQEWRQRLRDTRVLLANMQGAVTR